MNKRAKGSPDGKRMHRSDVGRLSTAMPGSRADRRRAEQRARKKRKGGNNAPA